MGAVGEGDERGRLTGRTLGGGKYRLESLIGRGAMGEVYRARHTSLPRRFAVKVLGTTGHDPAELQARFRVEARVASRLEHPNCVQIVDFGEEREDALLYLVMEYLDGVDLDALLRDEGLLMPARAIDIADQVASVLAEAHAKGVVHRDLKPSNVMILRAQSTGGGEFVKVCDFGIARILDGEEAPRLTQVGAMMGTPGYMAPEQFDGGDVDARADVFAWGALLYRMLSGRPAYQGSLGQIVYQITNAGAPPLLQVAPHLDPALAALVERAMARKAADRFADGRALQAALRALGLVQRGSQPPGAPPRGMGAAPSPAPMITGPIELSAREAAGTLADGAEPLAVRAGRVLQHPLSVVGAVAATVVGAVLLALLVLRGGGADGPAGGDDVVVIGPVGSAVIAGALLPTAAAADAGLAPEASAPAEVPEPAATEAPVTAVPDPVTPVPVTPPPTPPTTAAPVRRPADLRPATLAVAVTREGVPVPADVFLDGQPHGKAPVVIESVAPGPHTIEVRESGRAPVRRAVRLRPAEDRAEPFFLGIGR